MADKIITKVSELRSEPKSERLHVLVTPTMFKTLKALSEETDISMNAIVNAALMEYLK